MGQQWGFITFLALRFLVVFHSSMVTFSILLVMYGFEVDPIFSHHLCFMGTFAIE